MKNRKNLFSKVTKLQKFDENNYVEIYIVDDFEDEELQKVFSDAVNREDWEYCEALKAEADSRGLILYNKIKH